MVTLINEYVRDSALRNPYEGKERIMKWADILYRKRKKKIVSSRNKPHFGKYKAKAKVPDDPISEKDIVYNVKPKEYENRINVALENSIPTWDISHVDLETMFHKTRLEEYFDWEYTTFGCFKKKIKRRITWLFPEDGILICIIIKF